MAADQTWLAKANELSAVYFQNQPAPDALLAAWDSVAPLVCVTLTDSQTASLAALALAIGSDAFAGSSILQFVNMQNFLSVADDLMIWNSTLPTNPGAREALRGAFLADSSQ